jgi:hypothetical protein
MGELKRNKSTKLVILRTLTGGKGTKDLLFVLPTTRFIPRGSEIPVFD